MSITHLLILGLAAIAGGAVNALAGGGTLITFPVLTAVGVPFVSANITNTVALCPGYLGATIAQMRDLRGQSLRLWFLIPISIIGGVGGGILLLHTSDHVFAKTVPYLILLAVILMALQDQIRAFLLRKTGKTETSPFHEAWIILPILPAAVYGGYFGAGLSIITIAVLCVVINDSIIRLNALKQILAFSINTAACIFFLFSGKIVWSAALVMAVCALAGGALGGWMAGKVKPLTLRYIVIGIGTIVALYYFIH